MNVAFVWQVYPKDTPLSLFTALLPQDLAHVADADLRARVWNAVESARAWMKREEQVRQPSLGNLIYSPDCL